jgi:hypothetical protein
LAPSLTRTSPMATRSTPTRTCSSSHRVQGAVIDRSDPHYDATRQIWNRVGKARGAEVIFQSWQGKMGPGHGIADAASPRQKGLSLRRPDVGGATMCVLMP